MNEVRAVPTNVIDSLLEDCQTPEDLLGENGLLRQLTKAVMERAIRAEMSRRLGEGKRQPLTISTEQPFEKRTRKKSVDNFMEPRLPSPKREAVEFESRTPT